MTSEDDVRRLLAELAERDAADPPPMPADVAARLDETLAGLAAQPSVQPEPADVVPLRRRLRPALAAAAAVVVIAGSGAAVAAGLLDGGSGEQTTSFDAGGSAAGSDTPSASAGESESAPSQSPTEEGTRELRSLSRDGTVEIVRRDLGGQVEQLVSEGRLPLDSAEARAESDSAGERCVVPAPPEGDRLLVRFDTDLATLVVGPAEGGTRAVQVFSCAGGEVVAETQVRADLAPR